MARTSPYSWRYTVDVSSVFHDDTLSLRKKAESIRETFNRVVPAEPRSVREPLEFLLEDLVDASSLEDPDDALSEFDATWDQIYDWADAERVWVSTR